MTTHQAQASTSGVRGATSPVPGAWAGLKLEAIVTPDSDVDRSKACDADLGADQARREAEFPGPRSIRTDHVHHLHFGGKTMTTLRFKQSTTSTPEQFIAGLTDFGPKRSELFPNSADAYLKVHDQGPDWADVTEGSKGTWERLHYDWSRADRVVLTTTDSNAWGGASGHTYTFTANPDGTTEVELVSVRDGKNFKGHFFAGVFALFGKRILGPAFVSSVKAIEARSKDPRGSSGSPSSTATHAGPSSSADGTGEARPGMGT